MHARIAILFSIFLAASSAGAEPPPQPPIKNKFAFDVMHPEASCRKVTGKLLRDLERRFLCVAGGSDTASGRPTDAQCTERTAKPKRLFLVFAAKADCIEERETQLANGD